MRSLRLALKPMGGNAGARMINESAGMLASIPADLLEALVIDNDMLGSINRTVRGIEITPDTLSTQVLNRPNPDHLTPEADALIRETFPIHLAPIR